jgi:hypothetical protein
MGGAELLAPSPRGTDIRFADMGDRPTRAQKREDQQERKDARAATRADLEAERKAGIFAEDAETRRRAFPLRTDDLGADTDPDFADISSADAGTSGISSADAGTSGISTVDAGTSGASSADAGNAGESGNDD